MPASGLIIAPVIANAEELPRLLRRLVEAFLVLCSVAILVLASLSIRIAAALSVSTSLRFLPIMFALVGLGGIVVYVLRRQTRPAVFLLSATMCVTFVVMQWAWSSEGYLPATRLAASVPSGSASSTLRIS